MRWLVLGTLATLALAVSACSSSDAADSGTGNTGCTKPNDCQTGFACIAGACGLPGTVGSGNICWASRDCTTGNYCSPITGRCAPSGEGFAGAGCTTDGDCAPGLRCDYSGFTSLCVVAGSADLQGSCTSNDDCIAGLYCNGSNGCQRFSEAFTSFAGVTCPTDTGPFHSYFEVPRGGAALGDFFRQPYPSDVRVSATKQLNLVGFPTPGTTVLGVDPVKIYLDALSADFDGFSTLPVIDFRFSADVDAGNQGPLAQTAIHIVDLMDPNESPGYSYSYDPGKSKFYCPFFLTIAPNTTFKFGHTYAVWLDDTVRSATGAPATPDADLTAVLGTTRPTDADLGNAWDKFAGFRSYLANKNVATTRVVNAAVFTVADPTVHMQRVAAAVAAEQTPTLSALFQCGVTTGTDACDDGTAARKCGTASNDFVEIHGKINLPIYQKGTEPYTTTSEGALNESGGTVTSVRHEDVCFALTIPKGTAPGGGWPLVVYGHGTGGSFREFIANDVADELAVKGIAAVGIDEVGHGARRGTSTLDPSNLVFNVVNPPAARDNWLQMGADVLSVLKLPHAATPAGWTGPALSFNAAKLVYFGHSQGSTAGEIAVPWTEDVHAIVVSGAGALLRESLNAKTSPNNVLAEIEFVLGEDVPESHPVYLIWQNYFDRIDPFSSNRLMIQQPPSGKTAKHVFMTMGAGDTFAPPATLSLNATTLGLGKTDPVIIDFDGPSVSRPVSKNVMNVTAAAFQYQPSGYDGHFVAQQNPDAVRDWTAFITSYFSTGTPTVP